MKPLRLLLPALACVLLAGCLEVEQHPPWRQGRYNGKPDDLPQQRNFHNDRMAWMATVINRNWHQDEYLRTGDRGADYD
jgi:outer membrane biogenesis lipoprotein LolB